MADKPKRKYCPVIGQELDICFTPCPWLVRDKCTYDPLIVKELADLKAMRQTKRY